MKNLSAAIIAIIAILPFAFYSCGHKCSTPFVDRIQIIPKDSATSYFYVDIVSFNAGANFTGRVDSSVEDIHDNSFPVSFRYDREYKMTLHPGNGVHTFQYVSTGNEKTYTPQGKESNECTTSITYKVDDSTVRRPMMDYYTGGGPEMTITIKD